MFSKIIQSFCNYFDILTQAKAEDQLLREVVLRSYNPALFGKPEEEKFLLELECKIPAKCHSVVRGRNDIHVKSIQKKWSVVIKFGLKHISVFGREENAAAACAALHGFVPFEVRVILQFYIYYLLH